MTSEDTVVTNPGAPLDVVRHEEQLRIGLTRAPFRRVQVHRRIVTETRMIEVEVRSEVLDIDWHEADPADPADPAGASPERLEFVLHAEEPEVRVVTVPRERIILTRVNVPGTTDVHADLRSERITIDTAQPTE